MDKREGYGKQTEPDGSIYEGEWHNDKKDGKGTLKLPNGLVLRGTWLEDQMHGEVTHKADDGKEVKRLYKNGVNIMSKQGVILKKKESDRAWLNWSLVIGSIGCGVAALLVKDEGTKKTLGYIAGAGWLC